MYRNAVLRTLNRRLFSAILKTLFEAARNAHIDPYASKGILSVQQLQVLIDAVKDSYQTFLLCFRLSQAKPFHHHADLKSPYGCHGRSAGL